MSDPWRHRLSEYLDGDLASDEHEELELHLVECPPCRGVLADLSDLVGQAGELEDRMPPQDLWPLIQSRLDLPQTATARERRRTAPRVVSLSLRQLLAACVAVMAVSGAMGWLGASFSPSADSDPATMASRDSGPGTDTIAAGSSADGLAEAMAQYQISIEQLEAALRTSADNLDDETREAIVRNLRSIDQAIFESRAALERDPQSEFLNAHLARAIKSKVRLLRHANDLAANQI